MVRSAERTTLCRALRSCLVVFPYQAGDAPSQHALDGAGIEALQDWSGCSEFIQPPEMEQSLSGFLYHGVQVGRPRQIIGDLDTEVLKCIHPFHSGPVYG